MDYKREDRVAYNQTTNTLSLYKHDYGLLSNASVTLEALIHHQYNPVLDKIINVAWPSTSVWNKPDKAERNVYDLYFERDSEHFKEIPDKQPYFDARVGVCNGLNYEALTTFIKTYFNLSKEVLNIFKYFVEEYKIDFNNTIGVCYRGTDKDLEVPRVDPIEYLKIIDTLPSYYRVLIQTDQQQTLDLFYKNLGSRMFHFKELPVTGGSIAIHLLPDKKISNYLIGINYIASINIVSKCKYAIFGSCNAASWINLFRGGNKNTCLLQSDYSIPKVEIINQLEVNTIIQEII